LCAALRAVGLTPLCEPVLDRRVVNDAGDLISRLGPDDWLVLTSVYAVETVVLEPSCVPRVAVVSEPSRRAAEARGFRVELVSPRGYGKSLFEALRAKATSGTVCYPRSSLVKEPEPWSGIDLLSPVLYETVPRAFDTSVIDRVSIIAVVSPSAVDAILVVRSKLQDKKLASIGPTTSATLRKHAIELWLEAPEPSFEALAAAIAAQTTDSRHHRA